MTTLTRSHVMTRFAVLAAVLATISLAPAAARAADAGAHFLHVATVDNIDGQTTAVRHPLLDGNPGAIFHVTQSFNPRGSTGVYNDQAIGVYYNGATGIWYIFNQSLAAMPVGAAFNVWVPPAGASSFVHVAVLGNTLDNFTIVDNPLCNGNAGAILRVTQNWNPGGSGGGVYNDHPMGVYFFTPTSWEIFNEDNAPMPIGASFNVTVLPSDPTVFLHSATAGNIFSNWTVIDNPLTNNRPDALVSVTQNYNPGGIPGVYNEHEVGVWYDGSRWAIFNQDMTAMPVNAQFNVSVPPAGSDLFVHVADAGNTLSNLTRLASGLTSANPNAILFVTASWNPDGGPGVYNDHATGVYYDGVQWAIFNQDAASMPLGAAFNVWVPPVDGASFVHTTWSGNTFENITWLNGSVTDGDPNAIVHVTGNWNPSGIGGSYHDHAIGVYYTGTEWAIFNQDLATMPAGVSFNVWAPPVDAASYVHTADGVNTLDNVTFLDHPIANGNPLAIVIATSNWNPGGAAGVYNDHEIGVYYDGTRWAVFNQDLAPMPLGASFNITVKDSPFFADGFETGDTSRWSTTQP